MLLAITIAKALIEVAAASLLAQGIVALFSPKNRHQNPIYQLFGILTRPINQCVRRIAPKVILDQHIPILSFLLLTLLWVCTVILKIIEVKGLHS